MVALNSHASTILQTRAQEYMEQELPDIQATFTRDRSVWDHSASIPLDNKKGKWIPNSHFLDW